MRKAKKKPKEANKKPTRRPRILTTRTVGFLHDGSSATFGALVQQVLLNALPADVVIDARYAADPHSPPIDQIADNLIAAARAAGRRNYVIVAAGGPETAVLLRDRTQHLPDNPQSSSQLSPIPVPLIWGVGACQKCHRTRSHQSDRNGGPNVRERPRPAGDTVSSRAPTSAHGTFGILVAHRRPGKDDQFRNVRDYATHSLGLQVRRNQLPNNNDVMNSADIVVALADFIRQGQGVKGVVVMADSFFNDLRNEVVAIANASGLPTIYQWKEFVEAGGLISFGPNIGNAYDMAGQFAGRILGPPGEEPEDMQVSTPAQSTFEVWMKISTAQLLNIPIPPRVSALGIVYPVNTIP